MRRFGVLVRQSIGLGTDPLTHELQNAFEHGRFDGLATLDPLRDRGHTLEQLIEDFITTKAGLKDPDRMFYPSNEERDTARKTAEGRYNNALLHLMDALHSASDRAGQRLTHKDVCEDVRAVITAHFIALYDKRTELQKRLAGAGSIEEELVDFYFEHIRPSVLTKDGDHATLGSAASTVSTAASVGADPRAGTALSKEEAQRSAVWLALVFRMFAWLFLHEFNPKDRMIERTEYMNSRLPVYIG